MRDAGFGLYGVIWRAGGMVRFALLALACGTDGLRIWQVDHPRMLLLVCALMALWSVCTWFWNQNPAMRTWLWMGLDVAVTIALVLTSRPILGVTALSQGYLGVTVYWMASAPIVLAIWRGPAIGFITGTVVGLSQFLQLPSSTPRAWLDLACLIIVPAFVGLAASELDKLMRQRDHDRVVAVALAERERLNRIVHDGVLQVLAMMVHEGDELGPKGQRLAQLAEEQESRLRALLQDKGIDVDADDAASSASMMDVVAMVTRRESSSVSVSVMAGAVAMATQRAQELDAAIGEALANVAKHAGPGAHAWILLEQDRGELIVTLRDDGVGMTVEQAQQAVEAGRLGIEESIKGRIRALGGTCIWRSQPQRGVEWEYRVPLNV